MTPSSEGRTYVSNIQCLTCGNDIWLDDATYANYQGRVVCSACRGHQDVVIQRKQLVTASLVGDIYEPIRDILAWDVPIDILMDIAEASLCLGVSALKSCVVMCRRCVQAVLIEKGIDDNPNMRDMIAEAHTKGILSEELMHNANAVRFFAVTGAHPKDPMLRRVTKTQALLSIEVAKDILKGVYLLKQPEPEQLALGEQSGKDSNAP